MGFGYGHLVQGGMSAGNDKIKLQSVDVSKQMLKLLLKKLSKRLLKNIQDNATVNLVMGSDIQNLVLHRLRVLFLGVIIPQSNKLLSLECFILSL